MDSDEVVNSEEGAGHCGDSVRRDFAKILAWDGDSSARSRKNLGINKRMFYLDGQTTGGEARSTIIGVIGSLII